MLSEATGGAGAGPRASLRDWRNTKKLVAVRMLARGRGNPNPNLYPSPDPNPNPSPSPNPNPTPQQVRMLARGRGYAGAPPLVPGPLRRPPSGFALAAAFDTVKADEHSAHGGRERVSVGKRHSTADAQVRPRGSGSGSGCRVRVRARARAT